MAVAISPAPAAARKPAMPPAARAGRKAVPRINASRGVSMEKGGFRAAFYVLTSLVLCQVVADNTPSRARSSAAEHTLHTGGVTGSIPVAPTIFLKIICKITIPDRCDALIAAHIAMQ